MCSVGSVCGDKVSSSDKVPGCWSSEDFQVPFKRKVLFKKEHKKDLVHQLKKLVVLKSVKPKGEDSHTDGRGGFEIFSFCVNPQRDYDPTQRSSVELQLRWGEKNKNREQTRDASVNQ